MEIVSEARHALSAEAAAYLKKLRAILRYLAPATATWTKARCAATSTSGAESRAKAIGTRCEIKNVNSIRYVAQAIEYEAQRQIEVLEERRHDQTGDGSGIPTRVPTRSMRSKEQTHDYRYFPIPISCRSISTRPGSKRHQRTGTPRSKRERFIRTTACRITTPRAGGWNARPAEYFTRPSQRPRSLLAANWVSSELFGQLNKASKSIS